MGENVSWLDDPEENIDYELLVVGIIVQLSEKKRVVLAEVHALG